MDYTMVSYSYAHTYYQMLSPLDNQKLTFGEIGLEQGWAKYILHAGSGPPGPFILPAVPPNELCPTQPFYPQGWE